MSDGKQGSSGERQQLRDRISDAQARSQSSSSKRPGQYDSSNRPTPPDPRTLVERTVDDHPLALLAGSLIMGVVAANLMQASFGRKIAGRLLGLVAVAAEVGASLGSKTLDAAAEAGRAGQERLTHLGETVAEEGAEVRRKAAELGAQAGRRALSLASDAAAEAREAGDSALKRLGKLTHRQ